MISTTISLLKRVNQREIYGLASQTLKKKANGSVTTELLSRGSNGDQASHLTINIPTQI